MLGHRSVFADVLIAPLTTISVIIPVVARMIADPRPGAVINERIVWIFEDGQWVF
jgi:hypothetical protein